MKIRCVTRDFYRDLARCVVSAADGSPQAALGCLLITATDSIRLSAANAQTGIDATVAGDVLAQGQALVPAKKLLELVKLLPGPDLVISLRDNFSIDLKSGKARFELNGINPAEFPARRETPSAVSCRLPASELLGLFAEVQCCIGNDEARQYLQGVHLRWREDRLCAATTDTSRMMLTSRPCATPEGGWPDAGVVWPKRGIVELTKAFGDSEAELLVCQDQGFATVSDGSTTCYLQLLAGNFPDVYRVLPKVGGSVAVLARKELFEACRRSVVVCGDKAPSFLFTLSAEGAFLQTQAAETGAGADELACQFSGESLQLRVNPRFLSDALGSFSGETVQLSCASATSPLLIRCAEASQELSAVIMPLRL